MMRTFETGATRDSDETKHDPEGFNHPLVELRFCEYMTKHRVQANGDVRASDNWQKGIPKDVYMKSIWRHILDLWLHHRGYGLKAKEPLEDALCALRFNIDGYLFEVLKGREAQNQARGLSDQIKAQYQAQSNAEPSLRSGLGGALGPRG